MHRYTIDGELVVHHWKIANHYARTWLSLDLAASIPFDWFIYGVRFETSETTSTQALVLLRIIKALKLLRLLRVARLYRYVLKLQDYFGFLSSGVLRLISIGFMIAGFAH